MSVGRRAFIILGGGAAVAGGTYAWLQRLGYDVDPPLDPLTRTSRPKAPGLSGPPFDPLALVVLAKVVDHLIPGDLENGLPTGSRAGVLDYLVAAAGAPGLVPVRNEVLKLTRLLDIVAKKTSQKPFAELDAVAQRAILDEAAGGKHDRTTFKPARAVEATLRLALEGYLGHPHHGGNRDAEVWDKLSIAMPRQRTTHHHEG